MSKEELKQYYHILEVNEDASLEEVEHAYMHLKQLYSSNSMIIMPMEEEFSGEDRKKILVQVEEAYREISRFIADRVPESRSMIAEADTLAEKVVEVETPPPPDLGRGSFFRQTRESLGRSISDLSSELDIPYQTLQDIELENYETMTDAGQLRWCVSTYARGLSLDPRQTADEYMKYFRIWLRDRK